MCFQQRGQSQEQIAQYRNHLPKPLPRFLSRHNLKQIHECAQLKWWNWKVREKRSITSSKKSAYPSAVEGDKGSEERERAFLRWEIAWNKRWPESTRPPPSSLSVSTAWDGQNREEERMRSGRYDRIDCNSSLSSILCTQTKPTPEGSHHCRCPLLRRTPATAFFSAAENAAHNLQGAATVNWRCTSMWLQFGDED